MPISKDDFIESINAIQTTYQFQDGLMNFAHDFEKTHQSTYIDIGCCIFPDCSNALLKLLESLTKCGDMISYWCYELNFGEDWHEGCVTDKDGNDIPLSTVDDLYNYLANSYSDN